MAPMPSSMMICSVPGFSTLSCDRTNSDRSVSATTISRTMTMNGGIT